MLKPLDPVDCARGAPCPVAEDPPEPRQIAADANDPPRDLRGTLNTVANQPLDAAFTRRPSPPVLRAAPPPLVDRSATPETRALFTNLRRLAGSGILFGHHDSTAYGVGWSRPEGSAIVPRSDVKDTTGTMPAVYGWDAMDLLQNPAGAANVRRLIVEAYERGGVNTLSWHLRNLVSGKDAWDTTNAVSKLLPGGSHHEIFKKELNALADFMWTLKDRNGAVIPIVFRPWHEHNGGWFWWGAKHCTAEEYKQLWRYTVEFLRDQRGLHHLLYAYSPDRFASEGAYLERYPGDAYVDVLGLDNYSDFKSERRMPDLVRQLRTLVTLAENRGKIAALTEMGRERIPSRDFWTDQVLKHIEADPVARNISWMMAWRNAHGGHYYVPFRGHPNAPDFKRFEESPFTLFERDIAGGKLYQPY
jgi:mannan endo-1,4-beta-mannosidase